MKTFSSFLTVTVLCLIGTAAQAQPGPRGGMAALFDPPADFKRYDNVMSLMQGEMMKRLGGAGGPPRQ